MFESWVTMVGLIKFTRSFSSESTCVHYLRQLRREEGFRCPKCDQC